MQFSLNRFSWWPVSTGAFPRCRKHQLPANANWCQVNRKNYVLNLLNYCVSRGVIRHSRFVLVAFLLPQSYNVRVFHAVRSYRKPPDAHTNFPISTHSSIFTHRKMKIYHARTTQLTITPKTNWPIRLIQLTIDSILLMNFHLPFVKWWLVVEWKACWYMTCKLFPMSSMSCHFNHWENEAAFHSQLNIYWFLRRSRGVG